MKKNLLFILLDGCEFNVFENQRFASKIAPNISCLIKNGVLKNSYEWDDNSSFTSIYINSNIPPRLSGI